MQTPTMHSSTLHDYQLIAPLGAGTYGKAWLSRHRQSGEVFAIKIISRNSSDSREDRQQTIREEARNMRFLNSRFPFVTHLWSTFSNDVFSFLVMEYASGGTIFSLLQKQGTLKEIHTQLYVAELACALDHFHSLKMVFRDLKTENILICADGHLKVTDFGLAVMGEDKMTRFCGTLFTMAPEIFERKPYDFKVDWYALGICMHEMLTGVVPFHRYVHEPSIFIRKVRKRIITLPSGFSLDCQNLFEALVDKNPDKRLGNFQILLRQPWLRRFTAEGIRSKNYRPAYVPVPVARDNLDHYPLDTVHPEAKEYYNCDEYRKGCC